MSMELMVKAMKTKVGNPLRKLVLIKLADNANDQGECWPSYQHVADQCEMDRSTVRKHIKELERIGLLAVENRDGPKGNSSNVYHLRLGRVGPESTGVGPESTGGVGPESTRTSHYSEPVKETTLVVAEATTGEQEKSERVPFQKIQGIYNAVCGGTLPGCLTLNEKRKRNIRKCWNLQINGKYPFRKSEFWEGYFHDCLQNQHWTGNNDRGWRAHLEFLTREENVLRVLEGQA